MRPLCFAVLYFIATQSGMCQTSSPKYERGTVIAVAKHQTTASDSAIARYDVSVQVGNKVYVVLYTPPNGANSVEYAAGFDFLVLVGKDTLTFPSKLSGTTEVPILRTETLPEQSVLDWSKAPSQYFAMKMQHLSESLELSDDQQAKVKPIAQQEAADAAQVCFTSVIPVKERLNRWEKIVRSSDTRMKPILSQAQWDKLQDIRKEQKQEIKKWLANESTGKRK